MSPMGLPSEMSPPSSTRAVGLPATSDSSSPARYAAPPTSSNMSGALPCCAITHLCGVRRAWVSFMWKTVKGEPAARFAEQLAVVPPPEPAQLQVHGPVPLTLEGV